MTEITKRKFSPVLILLIVLILVIAGGIYYYFNFRQTESLELVPTSTEVSSSTDDRTLEKELNDTDLGPFETDLNKLDTEVKQL